MIEIKAADTPDRLEYLPSGASVGLRPREKTTGSKGALALPSLDRKTIAAVLVAVLLLLIPVLFKLDGHPHADWQQFLGRFHPAVVHLPIAILLLVPLFEIAGYLRPSLREAAAILLAIALPASLLSVLLGFLLAYGSGTSGSVVTIHMWSGIVLTIAVMATLFLRPAWLGDRLPYAYPLLLAAIAALTLWTGHQGGSITYGTKYLTEYSPLRKTPVNAGPSFYSQHINPVFDANCVACHSASKSKGGLRLDSYKALMRGGQEGSAIVPGKPEQSTLFKRITLPPTDKHFMPTEGKPPLKPEEIAWIRAWIADGASETALTVAGVTITERTDATLPQVGDYSKLQGQIAQIEKAENIRLTPVSMKPADGLILNTVDAGRTFGDAQLVPLEKLAPYIVEANLARTSVTDSGFDVLSKFNHLRALHLEDTPVTGQNLGKLTRLSELRYLNLSGTKVTQFSVAPAAQIKSLQHLYLFNTPAQPAPPAAPSVAALPIPASRATAPQPALASPPTKPPAGKTPVASSPPVLPKGAAPAVP